MRKLVLVLTKVLFLLSQLEKGRALMHLELVLFPGLKSFPTIGTIFFQLTQMHSVSHRDT